MPNISRIQALCRMMMGLTLLAWAAARFTRRPYCPFSFIMALFGAQKTAEGTLRFCPLVALRKRCYERD
ncbi:YgaP family membrane protein [Shouchella lonarensis]|uniref:Inner membrane protein YgaP-like transmembrane domain-containing protein n=1 Tax=Shouchella lonarensis TaxID=1464122 RepID=A0A1G6MLR9_9BACI|nr:DUF2892 domain-containing protein [Shouchella lonarensis]SDC56177.1 Protein of unknown function [Shouchella lonarensis]